MSFNTRNIDAHAGNTGPHTKSRGNRSAIAADDSATPTQLFYFRFCLTAHF